MKLSPSSTMQSFQVPKTSHSPDFERDLCPRQNKEISWGKVHECPVMVYIDQAVARSARGRLVRGVGCNNRH